MMTFLKKSLRKIRHNSGFTLIEMILVLFVVGLLMLLIIPNMAAQKDKIQTDGDAALEKTVETQIELYKTIEGVPTATVNDLGAEYLTSEQKARYLEINAVP